MRNARRKNSGFTIAEMMLAMTIMALLLTALAATINASMENLSVNEGTYKTINNARQTLSRMCAELRTSKGVAVSEEDGLYALLKAIGIETPDPNEICTFADADGDVITYWRWGGSDDNIFKLKKDTVYLSKGFKSYVLCKDVTDMSFTKGFDPADPNVVRNVQMSITVNYGDVTKKLSTAAVIMRNMP